MRFKSLRIVSCLSGHKHFYLPFQRKREDLSLKLTVENCASNFQLISESLTILVFLVVLHFILKLLLCKQKLYSWDSLDWSWRRSHIANVDSQKHHQIARELTRLFSFTRKVFENIISKEIKSFIVIEIALLCVSVLWEYVRIFRHQNKILPSIYSIKTMLQAFVDGCRRSK